MSDWKEGAAKRRDARHIKVPDVAAKGSKRKDTKRWCRGKVGVEHDAKCLTPKEAGKDWMTGLMFEKRREEKRRRLLVCATCGKELAVYWGYDNEKKPEWVTR